MTPCRPARWGVWTFAACLLLLRAGLSLAVVPPWQHPDEPVHLLAVRLLAAAPDADLSIRRRDAEREIVRSMILNGWWRHRGLIDPTEPPYDGDFEAIIGARRPLGSLAYYRLVAAGVRVLGISGLYEQLQFMRLLSLGFGLLALAAGARGVWLVAGRPSALAVATLAATHPQFLLVATAATPDAATCALGAMIWWVLARQAVSGPTWPWVACAFAVGLCSGVVRRAGLPLGALAIGAAVLGAASLLRRLSGQQATFSAARPFLVGGVVVAFLALFGHELVQQLHFAWSLRPGGGILGATSPPAPYPYVIGVMHSAWFAAGWLTLPAQEWTARVVEGASAIAVAGGVGLAWAGTGRMAIAARLALALVGVQVAAVFASYYLNGLGAQGRYLLPVLFPWLVLLWSVLGHGVTRIAGGSARVLVVVCFVALDTAVVWGRLVPGFAAG